MTDPGPPPDANPAAVASARPGMPAPFRPGPGLRAAYVVWQLALTLALPLVLGRFLMRGRHEPLHRRHLAHRFGLGMLPAPAGCVWVFAASLGQTRAAAPLLRGLFARGMPVVLTHATAAGLAEGQRLFAAEIAAGRMRHGYGPLDLGPCLRLFLRRHRPRLGLIVDSDIWPGQVIEASRAGVPLAIVNGSCSDRAARRDGRGIARLRRVLFAGVAVALTRSQAHVARYVGAGMPPDTVHAVGDLTFDLTPQPAQTRAAVPVAEALRGAAGRGVLTLSSVTEADEPALLAMLGDLQARCSPPPAVVWVPRSPQRHAPVLARLRAMGFRAEAWSTMLDADLALRSGKAAHLAKVQVLVGDNFGEIGFHHALADVVFVGATLADRGGHTIIEPLAQGRPVLTGPSLCGIAASAQEHGALRALPDAAALTDEVVALFHDPARLAGLRSAAAGFAAAHAGAADRSLAVLEPWLGR